MFDKSIIKEALDNLPKRSHVIGVSDTTDIYSYCLGVFTRDGLEIILCKSMWNKNLFYEEVENLSKYFNAEIFKEK
jgi:hypothetical protein